MSATYRMTVDVGVNDAGALWTMASDLLTSMYGMDDEDIVETIGPRQDPDICQCMTMLLDPTRWNGCVVETVECAKTSGSADRGASPTPQIVGSTHAGSLSAAAR